MLGAERLSAYAKSLARGDEHDRRYSLEELEDLSCRDEVSAREKKILSRVLLANYHLRSVSERRAIAGFLEIWFHTESSRLVHRKMELARLEEIDFEARESLKAASLAVAPADELIRFLQTPPAEDLTEGLGLLMALETANTRIRTGTFPQKDLKHLASALKTARAHRACHIARPFLWRLEFVLENVEKVAAFSG